MMSTGPGTSITDTNAALIHFCPGTGSFASA